MFVFLDSDILMSWGLLLFKNISYLYVWASLVAQKVRIHLQCRRPGFNPWVGNIPWRRVWLPSPIFLPGESRGQRSLVGYSPWGCKESDTTEWLTLSFLNSLRNGPRLPTWLTLTVQIHTYTHVYIRHSVVKHYCEKRIGYMVQSPVVNVFSWDQTIFSHVRLFMTLWIIAH